MSAGQNQQQAGMWQAKLLPVTLQDARQLETFVLPGIISCGRSAAPPWHACIDSALILRSLALQSSGCCCRRIH